MWLELTDSLGNRTVVNMDLVVTLKEGTDGSTILETTAPLSGALHVVVVRESLDVVLGLMEGLRRSGAARQAVRPLERDADHISDGNEG
jgi:hypothetical protein